MKPVLILTPRQAAAVVLRSALRPEPRSGSYVLPVAALDEVDGDEDLAEFLGALPWCDEDDADH